LFAENKKERRENNEDRSDEGTARWGVHLLPLLQEDDGKKAPLALRFSLN
jgi:hypothetical protein